MEHLAQIALVLVIAALSIVGKTRSSKRRNRPRRRAASTRPRPSAPSSKRRTYPGDFTGSVRVEYSASLDGDADPGEVVWTWVPYEDDPTQGKDRPVLVVGRDGKWLLSLMLSSKDHDHDADDEARWGRRWLDIGAGPWDRQRRPSEVRLDRVIRVHPDDVRREGAIMDRPVFDKITRSL